MNMKRIFYKVFPLLSVSFLLTLTGCLNDSEYDNGINGIKPSIQNFVEVHLTSGNNTNLVNQAYDNATTVQTEEVVPVNLTSGPATSDLTIDFIQLNPLNSSVIDSLVNNLHDAGGNAIAGFNYPISGQLTIANPNNKVVIPKGSSTGYINFKINPSNFIGKNWVIGFKITGVSDAKYSISNLNVGVIKFNIKNKYDKTYNVKGVFNHPVNGPRNIDEDKRLLTINANTNQISVGDLGAAYTVDITIDPITNDVTYSNGNVYVIHPSAERSYYEPSTGKFYLHYYYVGGTGNRVIDEVYTPL